MNFFKLYIGDYLRDTGTLTLAEHGAYQLMLLEHYASEQPLPVGRELYRLLRADSKAERDAIDVVTARFWERTDEGLINRRALKEFGRAAEISDTNRAIALSREATKRARRQHDDSTKRAQSVPRTGTRSEHERSTNQTPDTRDTEDQREHIHGVCASALVEVRKSFPKADESADLVALVEQGATPGEIGAIAAEAATKGKGWPWVVTTVVGRRQDAAKLALAPKPEPPWHETRSGIVAKGVELGVGEWSEAEWHAGRAPQWPTYQAKVYAAAGYEPPRMSG